MTEAQLPGLESRPEPVPEIDTKAIAAGGRGSSEARVSAAHQDLGGGMYVEQVLDDSFVEVSVEVPAGHEETEAVDAETHRDSDDSKEIGRNALAGMRAVLASIPSSGGIFDASSEIPAYLRYGTTTRGELLEDKENDPGGWRPIGVSGTRTRSTNPVGSPGMRRRQTRSSR